MNETEQLLKKLGLTPGEAQVYLALIKNGESNVATLVQATELYRPAVYRALAGLEQKNLLVQSASARRRTYRAAPVQILSARVKELGDELNDVLPDLERTQERRVQRPAVRVFYGKEGVREVYADLVRTLARGSIFYRYTSEKDLDEVNSYLPKRYRQDRDNKHLERQVISNYASGLRKKGRLERGIKFVPKTFDLFEQNVIQLIYGKKLAIIDLNTLTSIIIESAPIAEFQTKLFKLLYHKI